MNAVVTSKKYLGIGYRYLCAISLFSNVQPQECKHLQCELKCKMLQLAIALLFSKTLIFDLQVAVVI